MPRDAWQFGLRHVPSSTGLDFPQEQFNRLMQSFRGQPADRYWLFQSMETAIFLGPSLVPVLLTIGSFDDMRSDVDRLHAAGQPRRQWP